MNRRTALLLIAAASAPLGACQQAQTAQGPLAGSAIGGPFTLTDQDGRTRTDKDFEGKYRLMYFGYTFCPDVCPTDAQKLAQGLRAFEKKDAARAARVQPIFVTIDPARDTPPVIKEWTAAFHPRLIGLTGTQAQIDGVLKTFRVYAQKAGGNGPNYLMDHSAMIYLFGPHGEPIDFVSQDAPADEVTAKLDRYVK
jgi:protein SCO1/2